MRNAIVWIFIFLSVFTFPAYSKSIEGKVVVVSDGDTVWVLLENGNRVKVRIWGIDTPEKFKSEKLKRDAKRCHVPKSVIRILGKLASKKAKEKLNGRKVLVETHGIGRYGRVLGRIFVDEEDFGLFMIRKGYACAYRTVPSSYFEAEREAKEKKIGLWGWAPKIMKCLCKK